MTSTSTAQTARLAERFARAKGRYHSQHAMCDLMDHLGLPCTRPGREASDPLPSPVTPAMLDAAEVRAMTLLSVSRDYEQMEVDPVVVENLRNRAALEAAQLGMLLSDIEGGENA